MFQVLKILIRIQEKYSRSLEKVKILSERFHLDIELLQMIFLNYINHNANSIVTGWIVFYSLIHGTFNIHPSDKNQNGSHLS